MNERALRIGGRAALMGAVLIVLKALATLLVLGSRAGASGIWVIYGVEIPAFVALAVAFWFLHGWFAATDAGLAGIARVAGLTGASVAVLSDLVELIGAPLPDELFAFVLLVSTTGIGIWLLVAGTLVGRSFSALQRSGWLGQVGGFGYILAAVRSALTLLAPTTAVLGGIGAFAPLLTLFGAVFFIRLGRFAATGKLAQGPI
jgi:hypothetical protein